MPERQGLNFGLVSDQAAPTVPVQLQVFDGSGQMLGEWSLSGQAATSLFGGLGALPAGSTIYFGITAGNPSSPGGPSAAIDYQLWVGLQSATSRARRSLPGTGTTGHVFGDPGRDRSAAVVRDRPRGTAIKREFTSRPDRAAERSGRLARGGRVAGNAIGEAIGGPIVRGRPRAGRPERFQRGGQQGMG